MLNLNFDRFLALASLTAGLLLPAMPMQAQVPGIVAPKLEPVFPWAPPKQPGPIIYGVPTTGNPGITNTTLVNPTIINSTVTNSTLINPTIINSSVNQPLVVNTVPVTGQVLVGTSLLPVTSQVLVGTSLWPQAVVVLQNYGFTTGYSVYQQVGTNTIYLQIGQQAWSLLPSTTKLELLQRVGGIYGVQGYSLVIESATRLPLGSYVCYGPGLCSPNILF